MRLRDVRVGSRLGLGFGAVTVLAALIAGLAVQSISRLQDSLEQLATARALTEAAGQAKFRTADFAGWQTGYAFDTLRGLPDATSDAVGQRKEFLASTEAFRADLDRLAGLPLSAPEQQSLDAATDAFEQYLRVDEQIITALREGTDAGRAAAGELASGEALEHFGVMAEHVNAVVDSVRAGSDAATVSAAEVAATAKRVLVLAAVLAAALGVALARLITRSVTAPVSAIGAALAALAAGNLTRPTGVDSRDELGQMAAALDTATASMRQAVAAMAESATTLSGSSEELSAVSRQIAASAEETSAQSDRVSAAAGQVSSNVQTVSAGAEEMGAAIREISHNTTEAARVGASAVQVAETATATVAKLGQSSAEIGDVVKVITSIAEQTNLLALNATIEAARAGEAGKGFAVVAHEVKELAQETAKATEDISRRVGTIQADTGSAVQAIEEITAIIGRINDFQNTIASAVEEQSATTNEMSRNVTEAATGAGDIAGTIVGVATAAQTTSEGVADSQRAASELARLATELQQTVSHFTY